MARSPHDSSFSSSSSSKRHSQRILGEGGDDKRKEDKEAEAAVSPEMIALSSCDDDVDAPPAPARKKWPSAAAEKAVSRFRAALASALPGRRRPVGFGPLVTGTLFGHRRGHLHFALQVDPRACPALLIELTTPTSALVREMASSTVRLALECEPRLPPGAAAAAARGGGKLLLEEPLWRAYCNGRKCGYAARRECRPADWRVLRAVEQVSTGAGVLPASAAAGDGAYGEMMYMRARFERVVGSKNSEAFYMMSPDGSNNGGGGGPELSIYLLRV